MKLIIKQIVWLILVITCFSACEPAPLQPAQSYAQFQSFSQLEIGSGFSVELQPGLQRQVLLYATNDQQERLSIRETNGLLSIHIQGNRGTTQPRLLITTPVLEALTLQGQTQLTTGHFDLPALQVHLMGSSSITMTGKIDQLTASLTGGSIYHGFGAPTRLATMSLSGGSEAQLNASQRIDLTATGGSLLRYKGSASVEQNILLGGSRIVPE
ncbi:MULTISPECIES: DUF2807 domain-containing protein [unclassified Spirosoma]|uniref:GIN domain-containing protein n=1 Tax=unclassified Spirosoma TaxID=2621999 RepID=UPI001ACD6ABF|nr:MULTISPECIES: DUF2807 domain-containing protein [unclassified Spirosoma]MBN8826535.1 DUF2807 domain-containing protein [Spirosoma sp.]